jgi:hypothetical protein
MTVFTVIRAEGWAGFPLHEELDEGKKEKQP